MDTAAFEEKLMEKLKSVEPFYWIESKIGYTTELTSQMDRKFYLNCERFTCLLENTTIDSDEKDAMTSFAGYVLTVRDSHYRSFFVKGESVARLYEQVRIGHLLLEQRRNQESTEKSLTLIKEIEGNLEGKVVEEQGCQCAEEGYVAGGPPFPCL